jgi:hypothetical protein
MPLLDRFRTGGRDWLLVRRQAARRQGRGALPSSAAPGSGGGACMSLHVSPNFPGVAMDVNRLPARAGERLLLRRLRRHAADGWSLWGLFRDGYLRQFPR